MTYAELAAVRGISALSAERLVRKHKWQRQTGHDGVVLVPLTEARKAGGSRRVSRPGHPPRTSAALVPDVRAVIREVIREISDAAPPDDRDDVREDIRALESANAALRETITAHEATIRDLRQRLDAAVGERRQERQLEAEERRRLLALLISPTRVPWWRRWFR
jgi:hypothetical protein